MLFSLRQKSSLQHKMHGVARVKSNKMSQLYFAQFGFILFETKSF